MLARAMLGGAPQGILMASSTPARQRSGNAARATALTAFLTRLHFYIGLFVGPFILVAALTGTLYVLTPQLENRLYADQLTTDSTGPQRPLAEQIAAAQASLHGEETLAKVRPAPAPGTTTRVMFHQPGLNDYEHLAVFVDPVTLEVKGTLVSYGTSGTLPARIVLDYLHRHLMLGEAGRIYSELAASWLWIAALGGVWMWWRTGRGGRGAGRSPRRRLRRWHSLTGLWLVVGLVFFSATGLTWSKWAGSNIGALRAQMGWVTPSLSVQLNGTAPANHAQGAHAGHGDHGTHGAPAMPTSLALWDQVLASARAAGIDAGKLEISPAANADSAWQVKELDRSWPTQVDAVAVDPRDMSITSRADFADYSLVAKLIRWGIDAHMGILFGLPNQLLLAAFGVALSAMTVLGYWMWWRRRPAPGATQALLCQSWARLGLPARLVSLLLALALGWSLPLMGASLLLFVLIDLLRARTAEAATEPA
ncbi:hypothetical protein B6S08_13090 [Oceanimonas doudoroffii]|uniref:Peptidase n=2 Tax=Oceanimonas doudoroffii TaxID=84158 RepID=A0A233RDE5_9GAMM|nr:hypothetical protein B6S08_13090 [Oceanimonas doudoroffii]